MRSLIFGLFLVIVSPMYAQSQSPVTGVWNTGEENTKVEIFENEGVLTGKIHSSDNKKVKIGLIMLKDLEAADGYWKGKIYSLKRQKWFDVLMKPNGNKLELEVSTGFYKKSLEWVRNNHN
ncbi:MAG: DUF2147 domain-containing protein [Bacteroidales bacterium]|nr:DUF2147 domain-containing protein [Bacteroidales bacterium]